MISASDLFYGEPTIFALVNKDHMPRQVLIYTTFALPTSPPWAQYYSHLGHFLHLRQVGETRTFAAGAGAWRRNLQLYP